MTFNMWVLIDVDLQTIEGVYPTRTEARMQKSTGLLLKKALITVL